MNPLLQSLKLWIDPIPRSGPENMAVDEWLLETCDSAILRIYEWEDGWGSLGCFCRLNQAIESNDSLRWVRRSTGGGVVEHQNDWTYTLVIPETENLGRVRSAQSYQQIHELLTIDSIDRSKQFASRLSGRWESWEPEIPRDWIETKIREKFSNPAWTERR
ncbi:MAG TPA: hypothetical protein VM511_01565 [Luteolibacter sp.]|nr:hypothetical protein [Luteolibacter sp.]